MTNRSLGKAAFCLARDINSADMGELFQPWTALGKVQEIPCPFGIHRSGFRQRKREARVGSAMDNGGDTFGEFPKGARIEAKIRPGYIATKNDDIAMRPESRKLLRIPAQDSNSAM